MTERTYDVADLHKCYAGVIFPDFVKPLANGRFGSKVMSRCGLSPEVLWFLKDLVFLKLTKLNVR